MDNYERYLSECYTNGITPLSPEEWGEKMAELNDGGGY